MKIIGIGTDIVLNNRVKKLIKNKNFLNRIYTNQEIKFAKKQKEISSFLAKRFAAKEAFAKALGTGFRKNLNFKDIEILNDKLGKPYYSINYKLKKIIFISLKVKNLDFFLSLSDEKLYSIAFAIIQKK